MSLSIIEVLLNAEFNLRPETAPFQKAIGHEQLRNAIVMLDAGKAVTDTFDIDECKEVRKKRGLSFI